MSILALNLHKTQMYLNILLLQHTAETCTGCFWCWAIWMFLSSLLGLFIGKWIWGKSPSVIEQKNKEIKVLKDNKNKIEKDFIAAKYQIDELKKDNKGLKASLGDFQTEIVSLGTQLSRLNTAQTKDSSHNSPLIQEDKTLNITDVKDIESTEKEVKADDDNNTILAPNQLQSSEDKKEEVIEKTAILTDAPIGNKLAYFSTILKADNLKIIEGVGLKIEDILNKEGYKTWSDIANSKVEDLKNIMHDAGPRYRIYNPATWNQQAKMAIKGDWQNLIDLQKILSSKRTGEDIEKSIPKIEKLIAKKIGFESILPSDLKIVEGIGSKIEELLKEKGITNLESMSNTSAAYIQQILSDGGERYKLADPSTWPKQATLAHQKDWLKLKELQDELRGGNEL